MASPILTRLSVQNFRAIGPGPVAVDLAPLTVFVGENGSGKSSLLQALALTAQSALDDPRRSDLLLDGSRVSLGPTDAKDYRAQYTEIYYGKDTHNPLSVFLEAHIDANEWPAATPAPKPKAPRSKAFFGRWPPTRVGYRWERTGLNWPAFSHELSADGQALLNIESRFTEVSDSSATQVTTWTAMGTADAMNRRQTQFRSPDRVLPEDFMRLRLADLVPDPAEGIYGYAQEVIEPVRAIASILRRRLDRISLVDPLRGRQFTHRDVGPDVSFVGPHGEMLVRFLSLIRNRSSSRYATFRAWAERFGFPGIETGTGGANELKVAFRDPTSGTVLELNDAATGSYQALLMAAQVLLSEPGSVLLYEEPENNLHPRYEKLLPDLYADAVRTGHQVIATTHSEVLVAAIGNEVRKGHLLDTDVAVWELSRSSKGVTANRIKVSDRGYMDGWVRSFAKVEEEMFNEWTEALPSEGARGSRGHPRSRGSGEVPKRPRRKPS